MARLGSTGKPQPGTLPAHKQGLWVVPILDSADVASAPADNLWRRVHHPERMSGLGFTFELGASAYLGMLGQCAPQPKRLIPATVSAQGLGNHIEAAWRMATDVLRAQLGRHCENLRKMNQLIDTRLNPAAERIRHRGPHAHWPRPRRHLDALPMTEPNLAHNVRPEAQFL